MNESFKFHILLLLLVILLPTRSNGESSTCVMVYKEGSAPAVFQSPKCPGWKLSNYASTTTTVTTTITDDPCQLIGDTSRLQKVPRGLHYLCP
ncbi:putative protein phosphatase 2c 51 [Quercus suber]|uniref:Secreted protein n=1 Tax=Quercus suber TaxID=58331 RepID=A0AAW0L9H7_QUESU